MAIFPWNNPQNPYNSSVLGQPQQQTQQSTQPWTLPAPANPEQTADAPFGYYQPLLSAQSPDEIKERSPDKVQPGVGFQQGGSWAPSSWRNESSTFMPQWIQSGQEQPNYQQPPANNQPQQAPGNPQQEPPSAAYWEEMYRQKYNNYMQQYNQYMAWYNDLMQQQQRMQQGYQAGQLSGQQAYWSNQQSPQQQQSNDQLGYRGMDGSRLNSGGGYSPTGLRYYQTQNVAQPYHFMQPASDAIQSVNIDGQQVYKFTLRPGYVNSFDRGNIGPGGLPNQRAEIGYAPPQDVQKMNSPYTATAQSGRKRYDISVMFDQNFPTNTKWATLFQFHPGQAPYNQWGVQGLQVHGNYITVPAPFTTGGNYPVQIPIQRGQWYNFSLDVNWSAGPDGYFRVYQDDHLLYEYRGKTADPNTYYYLQQGYYRDGSDNSTSSVYQTPLRVS